MEETLVALKIASQTKVSDLNLRALSIFIQEDVFVFNVSVYDLLQVDVFYPFC